MPRQVLQIFALLLVFISALGNSSFALSSDAFFNVNLADLTPGQKLDDVFFYYEDTHSEFELESILEQPAENWKKQEDGSLSFGYTDSTYWFRARLNNITAEDTERILEISYPVLDYINVFQQHNDGAWQLTELGDTQPFDQRELHHRFFLVPINVASNSTVDLVFQVNTSSAMQFPVKVWDSQSLHADDQKQLLAIGIYYGIMVAMLLYNFFVYFAVREKDYLYYVLYVGFLTLFLASLQGLSFQYLWPNATTWNDTSIVVTLGLAIIFGMLFTFNFLKINRLSVIKRLQFIMVTVLLAVIFSNVYVSYHHTIRILIVLAILCVILALTIGVYCWAQGHTSARYYVIAWSTILWGGFILALNKFDVISRTFMTENVVQIGSAIEVILLSFALADRLNQEKRERMNAQIKALENEKLARQAHYEALKHERQANEAQATALQVQKQATETLEDRVRERTEALEQANLRLELMSITDDLTNIRNRRYFDRTLKSELARSIRQQEPISVLIIDIDYFKGVNDSYGHQTGDAVLKAVADQLSKTINRSTDLLARFGGEEFVVILPDTTEEGAVHVAESIRQVIEQLEFDRLAQGLKVTMSIGAYGSVPTLESNYEHWVRNADDALYYAKNNGRNQVVNYTELKALQAKTTSSESEQYQRIDLPEL